MNILSKIRTILALGVINILRVVSYKFTIKLGLHPVTRLKSKPSKGPFFLLPLTINETLPSNSSWNKNIWFFGWLKVPIPKATPNWFENKFSQKLQPNNYYDWWRIPDFETGDIKGLWELSRFDWVAAWATEAAKGNSSNLKNLNIWLESWSQENPPYKGPNWKCGQEASIRVIHLVTASWILSQDENPQTGLIEIISSHLQRIVPTIHYAIGQQNNHGTSEAAALFIGGSFLLGKDRRAKSWVEVGRFWLEDRANKLISEDGSFSQYSVNYHRLMLDSYSLAEAWRAHRNLSPFSKQLIAKLQAATVWLEILTNDENGDAPNIGANDGARLLQLIDSKYRDFRPSVQLAAALFDKRDVYGHGPWNAPLGWLNVKMGARKSKIESHSFNDGGYHVLRKNKTMVIMRYPRFTFRPSQADSLHVDFWVSGENLLRDAGTYSYNSPYSKWYAGTSAHNTIAFDNRDQMPRIGRFLYGNWLKSKNIEKIKILDKKITAGASYIDWLGACHERFIELEENRMTCMDKISGPFSVACLNWRLKPGNWKVDGSRVINENIVIEITSDEVYVELKLGKTWESRFYQNEQEIPLLSVTIKKPAVIITRINY